MKLTQLELPLDCPQQLCSGKTFPEFSELGTTLLDAYWENLLEKSLPLRSPAGSGGDCGAVFRGRRKIAWRVLDAQFFGVPQRRRRVYLIASSRSDFNPAAVLFEPQGLSGHPQEVKRKGEEDPQCAEGRPAEVCWDMTHPCDVIRECGDKSPTLKARMGTGGNQVPLVITENQRGTVRLYSAANSLSGSGGKPGQGYQAAILPSGAVRKLMPVECERLQGFPDDWTRIPYRGKPADRCPDSPRYKAIGNSWAVPVVRWIGRRIQNELERCNSVF